MRSPTSPRAGGLMYKLVLLTCIALLGLSTLAYAAPTSKNSNRRRDNQEQYLLGVGKADVTGPVVEIGLMGYASLDQKGTGLRQRIYSRAFIVAEPATPSNRIVYVIADLAMGDTAVRHGVLAELQKLYPGVYTASNVAIVGTHSHSGPGAWLNYLLPQVTTLGFDKQSYNAIVTGITLSIKLAHESLTPGYLSLGKGTVEGASTQRSGYAYDANPLSERQKYLLQGDNVDTEMQLLLFENTSRKTLGLLNWFPTHGTSLYNNNTLISGDNKGYAAIRLEKYLALQPDTAPRPVTGFSQSNVGDVSPNTLGPVCMDTGLPCRYEDSTCNGKSQMCHGRGPGFRESDTESCRIVGERQFEAAREIYEKLKSGEGESLGAAQVRSFHTFVNMGQEGGYKFKDLKGVDRRTCKAALGFSFAAGTTDGPGAADFVQNDPGAPQNPMWLLVRNLLKAPSKDQEECHKPKPILLNVGEMDTPYAWSPNIVDVQMFRISTLTIIIAPGEATTMAGRRWKAAVAAGLEQTGIVEGPAGGTVVLGGPANTYTHYITTPEEYAVQRYEGASTLFGQFTLDAHISLNLKYLSYLAATPPATPIATGPKPPINTNNSISLITGVVTDAPGIGRKFGQVLVQPRGVSQSSYSRSAREEVKVVFVGANPRNNLRLEGDFVIVEKKVEEGKWVRYRGDDDWDLVYEWVRKDGLIGTSEVTARWRVERDADVGEYRVRYFGDEKALFGGKVTAFEGTSGVFRVGA